MDGMTILRKVQDGKKFNKAKKSKGKGKEKEKVSQKGNGVRNVMSCDEETEDSDASLSSPVVKKAKSKKAVPVRPVAPLPSRASSSRSSTQDSRPSKRKRQELSDREDSYPAIIPQPNRPASRIFAPENAQIQLESRAQLPRNSQRNHPAMPSTANYPRQPSDGPSRLTHSSQTTLGTAQTMVPLRHGSDRISTTRAPHHRQLTPVLEEQNYYPAAVQRQRPPSHPTDQYYASTHQGQPPFSHPNGRHHVSRLRPSHLADTNSVCYPPRYYSGSGTVGRDHDPYDYDERFDPDVAYYGEDYLYQP
jgi:hypothetical protein